MLLGTVNAFGMTLLATWLLWYDARRYTVIGSLGNRSMHTWIRVSGNGVKAGIAPLLRSRGDGALVVDHVSYHLRFDVDAMVMVGKVFKAVVGKPQRAPPSDPFSAFPDPCGRLSALVSASDLDWTFQHYWY